MEKTKHEIKRFIDWARSNRHINIFSDPFMAIDRYYLEKETLAKGKPIECTFELVEVPFEVRSHIIIRYPDDPQSVYRNRLDWETRMVPSAEEGEKYYQLYLKADGFTIATSDRDNTVLDRIPDGLVHDYCRNEKDTTGVNIYVADDEIFHWEMLYEKNLA